MKNITQATFNTKRTESWFQNRGTYWTVIFVYNPSMLNTLYKYKELGDSLVTFFDN